MKARQKRLLRHPEPPVIAKPVVEDSQRLDDFTDRFLAAVERRDALRAAARRQQRIATVIGFVFIAAVLVVLTFLVYTADRALWGH